MFTGFVNRFLKAKAEENTAHNPEEKGESRLQENHVTIGKVAQAAGVSKTTVSRYLNGRYGFMSAETKERIRAVVEALDYRPSNIARSLKSRSSRAVGCVIADIANPFSSILLKGVNDVCSKNGYQVLFSNTDDSAEREGASVRELLDSRVDGLIVNTAGGCDGVLTELDAGGVPVVLADRRIARENVLDTVTTDNYRATRACMKHLFENGFRKVACFTLGSGEASPRAERLRAYCDAVRELFGGERYVFDAGDGAAECAKRLAGFAGENPGERLAVFCVNGLALLAVLQSMREAGIRISGRFGVCGFDDWGWASLIPPGITTITQDSYAVGVESAKLLLRRIAGEKSPSPVCMELPNRLCVRGSTDPALAEEFFA